MPLFDQLSVSSRSAETPSATASLSSVGVNLALDALAVMLHRWRWATMTDGEWDTLEAEIADAIEAVMDSTLIGTIVWRPGAVADNELVCDGAQYDRVDYPLLYTRLDAIYILDADTFVVPDLLNRFVAGAGDNYAIGDTGGSDTHTLSEAEMPTHSHSYVPPVINVDIEAPGVPDPLAAGLGFPTQTGAAGSGQAHENRPPFEALTPCLIAR